MRLPIILLLFACCNSSTSLGVFNPGNVGIVPNPRTNKAFLNRVGDWYEHVKTRIYERLFGPTTETTTWMPEVLDLDRLEFQRRLRNRGRFLLDLSTLSFDAEKDWGFRIGNWYFIRKGYPNRDGFINNDSDEWDMQSAQQDDSTVNTDDLKHPEAMEPSSITPTTGVTAAPTIVTQSTMQQGDTQQPPAETTTQTDSFEGSVMPVERRTEDNEADSEFPYKGSVEVLMT